MSQSKISLVLFNASSKPSWDLGDVLLLDYSVESLFQNQEKIRALTADYLLFWDANIALPSSKDLQSAYSSPGNLWHIGTKLGLSGHPKILDYVQPTNMFHVECDDHIDHSSWKMTFRGCLMKARVFNLIDISEIFHSMESLALDFGYKALIAGVITRYSKSLSIHVEKEVHHISLKEQLKFIQQNFDKKALVWSYVNSFFYTAPSTFLTVLKGKRVMQKYYNHDLEKITQHKNKVSIVIATLNRYETLKEELKEISNLDYPIHEIIIVDQTDKELRSQNFLKDVGNLSVKYLESDVKGQCSSRNLGVKNATGDLIWFLDDDMKEFPKDYLNKHLDTLNSLNADVSCGIPDEVGTDYINRDQIRVGLSEGFPTNDVIIKKDLFDRVGGFDEKMDRLQSEDQELGIRCIKAGALSVKNNQLRLLHLRAGQGGLRQHNVRKITFSSSRKSLFQRRLLHFSEIYIALKHFSDRQVNSYIQLNKRGTFIVRGNIFKKIAKAIIAILVLPYTIAVLKTRKKLAKNLLVK